MNKEDTREYLFVSMISIILLISFVFTPINALLHESGHAITCSSLDGKYMITEETEAHTTRCEGFSGNVLLFYFGGILAEVVVGFFLLSLPLISLFGSLILINVVINLISGRYGLDIEKASEIVPALSSLNNPVIQVILMTGAFLLFILSLIYTYRIVKKLDIPFI